MIVLEAEALEELREIGRWYLRHRPEAADRCFQDFRATLRRVEAAPEAFPRMHGAPLVRRARFGRYPYRMCVPRDEHRRGPRARHTARPSPAALLEGARSSVHVAGRSRP